jgi:hypothetical protein
MRTHRCPSSDDVMSSTQILMVITPEEVFSRIQVRSHSDQKPTT